MTGDEGKFDGWIITEEQAELMSRGDGSIWSRFAFELFYWENYKRLREMAATFIAAWFRKRYMFMYDKEDCLQSLYMDGLQGYFRVKLERGYIEGAVRHAFTYMPVGGLDWTTLYNPREAAAA